MRTNSAWVPSMRVAEDPAARRAVRIHALVNQDVSSYFPYLAISLVLWNFLASLTNESCQSFIAAEEYIRNVNLADDRPRHASGVAQFKSILILILLGCGRSWPRWSAAPRTRLVILAVVVINALVGFYQEYRAERSLAALKSMLPSKARVRRDGVSHVIPADDVLSGDVLLLEAGDRVSADGRLWLAAGLEIDESALTGESHPAGKQTRLPVASDAPLGDRINMAYMNTLLTRGRAELLVTATGARTEMGRLSQQLAATEEVATPLASCNWTGSVSVWARSP